jgi:hypothetical protein
MNIVDIPKEDKPLMTVKEINKFIEYLSVSAKVYWSYFNDLKAQGFTEEQALELVKVFKIG